MEKVNVNQFDDAKIKNPVMAFIKTLDIGEVARIEKNEWNRKSPINVGVSSEMNRIGRRVSVQTFDSYCLIKRIK